MHIPVIRSERLVLTPGDFGAKFIDKALFIPAALYDTFEAPDVVDARDFVAQLTAFPKNVAKNMGWEQIQFDEAVTKLIAMLEVSAPNMRWRNESDSLEHPVGALRPHGDTPFT